jgi:Fur family peroxide stress response transcriptional regulator
MEQKRNTVQRQIILDAIKKVNAHPTIDEIYAEIHKKHPSISKTTVYRNLRQIAENKIIRQVSLPDGLERYDVRTDQHYHFKCKDCGSIFDVDIKYLEGINDEVQGKYGVQVDNHDIIFLGICPKCKK